MNETIFTTMETDDLEMNGQEAKEEQEEKKTVYDLLSESIMSSDLPDDEKSRRLARLLAIRGKKVNILLAGATGSGKSSTVNAMFNTEVAKVGVGVDPETDAIEKYELENLTIWDTPGLGDGKSDVKYHEMIVRKLSELDEEGAPLIDLVLVVLDASQKDLGTSYTLINDVIIPCLGEGGEKRILIGLNQADAAMKGHHWNEEANEPDETLNEYLKKKASSVRKRIHEATGVEVRPICYCAGYKEEGGEQRKPYNLTKLLYYIVSSIPKEKRLALVDNINTDEDMWLHDDKKADYRAKTSKEFFDEWGDWIQWKALQGSWRGEEVLGVVGKGFGYLFGGIWGIVSGPFVALAS